jgi:hypothetical protein
MFPIPLLRVLAVCLNILRDDSEKHAALSQHIEGQCAESYSFITDLGDRSLIFGTLKGPFDSSFDTDS